MRVTGDMIAKPTSAAFAGEAALGFDAASFQRIRQLIYQRAGISLHAGKQAMVYSRISRRLRSTGHASFGTYLQWLESSTGPGSEAEWQEFINCLTTNLTAFFREEHHFVALASDLRAQRATRVRIWCAAASTGEEPYSIAMTACEALGGPAGVEIVASDIDTRVLTTAEAGIYDADARGLTPERLRAHFLRGKGERRGLIRVKPELAKTIRFRRQNLMDEHWSLGPPFDAVFCRNVTIYFDTPTRRRVLERIHGTMRPGGLLYVGHSEHLGDSIDLFRLRGKTIYERV